VYALSEELWEISERNDRPLRRLLLELGLPALIAAIVIPFLQIAGRGKARRDRGDALRAAASRAAARAGGAEVEEPKPQEEAKRKPSHSEAAAQEGSVPAVRGADRRAGAQGRKATRQGADALAELRDQSLTGSESNTAAAGERAAPRAPALAVTPPRSSPRRRSEPGHRRMLEQHHQHAGSGTALGLTAAPRRWSGPKGFGKDRTRPGQSERPLNRGPHARGDPARVRSQQGRDLTIYNRALARQPSRSR